MRQRTSNPSSSVLPSVSSFHPAYHTLALHHITSSILHELPVETASTFQPGLQECDDTTDTYEKQRTHNCWYVYGKLGTEGEGQQQHSAEKE